MDETNGISILDEPEDREPSEEEVREYAEYLGIDLETESHLLWIAREGVVAPVPPPWKACTQNRDDVFYFNFETGESLWDHPCDEKYSRMVAHFRAQSRSTAGSSTAQADGRQLKSLLKDKRQMAPGEEHLRAKTSSVVFREQIVEEYCGTDSEESGGLSVPEDSDSNSGEEDLGRSGTAGSDQEGPEVLGYQYGAPLERIDSNDDSTQRGAQSKTSTSVSEAFPSASMSLLGVRSLPELSRMCSDSLSGTSYSGQDVRLRHRERMVRQAERLHGRTHPEVAHALHRLADQHGRSGNLQAQRAALESALNIHRKACGTDASAMDLLASLSEVNQRLGNKVASEKLKQRMLEIKKTGEKALTADPLPGLLQELTEPAEVPEKEPLPCTAGGASTSPLMQHPPPGVSLKSLETRLYGLKADLKSLSRILTIFEDIRSKQLQVLDLNIKLTV